jgi:hypothetical protein
MLAILACESWFTATLITVHHINAITIIFAWIIGTIVDVYVAHDTGPAWMANAFIAKETVHTCSVFAWFRYAQIDLFLTTFACKSWWTSTIEIVDQIRTIGSE